MLTALKMSSKCVFYKPEHNAKGGGGPGPMEFNFEDFKMKHTK